MLFFFNSSVSVKVKGHDCVKQEIDSPSKEQVYEGLELSVRVICVVQSH